MLVGVILTPELHYSLVMQLLNLNPVSVDILTYSVGQVEHDVLDSTDGRKIPSVLGVVLDILNRKVEARIIKQARIIATVPPSSEVVKTFHKIQWRGHCSSHAKAWIFHYQPGHEITRNDMNPVALVGSRNLTVSNWTEITVDIRGQVVVPVAMMFDALWKQGTNLSEDQDWFEQGQQLLAESDGDIV